MSYKVNYTELHWSGMLPEFGRLAMWNLRRKSRESQNYMAPVDIDEIEIAKDTCAEQPQVN